MLILLWHFYTTCTENSIVVYPLLMSVIDHGGFGFGGLGVGLFFILSGALLWHNYGDEEKFSTIVFFKKRIIRICIPLWISFVVSLLISSISNGGYINYVKENLLGCIISFFGFNFAGDLWNRIGINTVWITGEWFTSVILVVYSLFPLLRKLLKANRGGSIYYYRSRNNFCIQLEISNSIRWRRLFLIYQRYHVFLVRNDI